MYIYGHDGRCGRFGIFVSSPFFPPFFFYIHALPGLILVEGAHEGALMPGRTAGTTAPAPVEGLREEALAALGATHETAAVERTARVHWRPFALVERFHVELRRCQTGSASYPRGAAAVGVVALFR